MPRQTVTLAAATRGDLGSLVDLLEAAHLPTAGLPPSLAGFCVARNRGRVVGGIGVEVYGRHALLRSAVVAAELRGTGIGPMMVKYILDYARAEGVAEVFLLTTTAERFFRNMGFSVIARGEVPAAVTQSVEFQGACPASAIVMRTELSHETSAPPGAAEDG